MMRPHAPYSRRRFVQGGLALAGFGLLAGCGLVPIPGQRTVTVRRIGVLDEFPDAQPGQWEAFREGLHELGLVEGENIVIEARWIQGDADRVAPLIAELAGLGVECLVTGGVTSSSRAKQANTTIPMVVVLQNFDAVETGLVANIAHPEGNITGLAGVSGLQLWSKLPQVLKEAAPDLGRIAVLAYAKQPSIDVVLEGMKDATQRLGLQLDIATVQEPGDIEPALSAVHAAGARGLVIINQSLFGSARAQIVSLALTHRLPAITTDPQFPRAGGLMAYGIDRLDNFRRAASYVDKILRGAKPVDLPMERPRKYDLALNLKTAQALGLTIPQSVLAQATEIIQ
jgi:putative tryptophan/tyrosine transport system substrate-binding protein